MTRKQSFLQFLLSLMLYFIILPLFATFLSPIIFQLLPIHPKSNGLGELFFAGILAYLLSGLVIQFIFIIFNQKSFVDSLLRLQFEKNTFYIIQIIFKAILELAIVSISSFLIVFTSNIIENYEKSMLSVFLLMGSYAILILDAILRSFTQTHRGLIDRILQLKIKNSQTR
jgi:hypothetical protein